MSEIVINEKKLKAWGQFYRDTLRGVKKKDFLRALRENPKEFKKRVIMDMQKWHLLMFEPLSGRTKVEIPTVKNADLIVPHFRNVFQSMRS